MTLRCYVEDVARFLGRDGEIYLFDTPAGPGPLRAGTEDARPQEIASWPEVADTDVPPLPADQDRYDLTELSEVLAEVADGAAGLVDHRAFVQPVEGARDLAEYAGSTGSRSCSRPRRRWAAPSPGPSGTRAPPCAAEDAAVLRPASGTRS